MLTGDYRRLYFASVDNLSRGVFKTTVEFSSGGDLQSGIYQVLEAIFCGNPELFFVDQEVNIAYDGSSVTLTFPRKYDGENLAEALRKLDAEIDRIAEKVMRIEGSYERIMRVNQYLCARVKPDGSVKKENGDAYGALILKQARCEGFAKAAKLIFDRVGIKSIVAFGKATDGNGTVEHAWNILEVNGKYYQFDFTWNAGNTQHKIPGQEYAFLSDEAIKTDHFPKYPYPECNDESFEFWVKHNGIVKYQSDLGRIEVVPFGNNYYAAAKFLSPLSNVEVEENAFDWMRSELAAGSYGSTYTYSFNPRLNVLSFYMIND